ncbi:hypothetical protein LCGC14_2844400, partial [marine sediment metagenome]
SVLIFAVAVYTMLSLIRDGYYAYIRFKNERINKRIGILYRMGMEESANILQTPLLKYWR